MSDVIGPLSRIHCYVRATFAYLDPDIAAFGDLGELPALLDAHDILLTPHQLVRDDDVAAIADNEMGSLKHGIYNLGFIAVANTPEGRRFAQWCARRLEIHCYEDVAEGLFTDQKWCDLAPAFFAGTHILRDPGYNVVSWNLSQRPITIDADGSVCAGGRPLKFSHFTEVDHAGEVAIAHYAGEHIATFELLAWYKRLLGLNKPEGLPDRYWIYGVYAEGAPIPDWNRRKYRADAALRARFADPFKAGAALAEG